MTLLISPDNFTPPSRTPWGGRRIPERYKASLGIPLPDGPVGESWEVSVEPAFPSRMAGSGEDLGEVIARDPGAWLGQATAAQHGGRLPLLVKLLDTADLLSLQVHPHDGHPSLGPKESGKPEAWLVLEADPGSGIYLGWREGVERAEVEACLRSEGPLVDLLNFVAVAPGEVYAIPPGVPHAIGPGLTLVEPQLVRPGCRGVTYRFWDWGRRYDPSGRLDPSGLPRPLHLEESLACTDWDAPQGEALTRVCRALPRVLEPGPPSRTILLGWEHFLVEDWQGTGDLRVPAPGELWALVCVAGRALLSSSAGQADIQRGQSAVVPASAGELQISGEDVRIVSTRLPAGGP
ncbi:MAG: class I mannose-6-phosphate isomerase [Polyangia bacterium]|jgi:mannose-6-phosphate isomerase|nr:class I mannose-6-phosphate isomerase [Polyangia bacterium]